MELGMATGPPIRVSAGTLRVEFDGEVPRTISFDGLVVAVREAQRLRGRSLRGSRDEAGNWELCVEGDVTAVLALANSPMEVSTDRLFARTDPATRLRDMAAEGSVRIVGKGLLAEAGRATLDSVTSTVELQSASGKLARLSRDRLRVAAEFLRTDLQGSWLDGRGRVEAAVLGSAAVEGVRSRVFAADQTVHFVADELGVRESGRKNTFRGGARGWQGDRNLSADEIETDEATGRLHARGSVETRMPRTSSDANASVDAFVRIAAETFDFDEKTGLGAYGGGVRVWIAEGRIDGRRLEITLVGEKRELASAVVSGDVRFEFLRNSLGESLELPATGTGERMVWDAAGGSVDLSGEREPAMVVRGSGVGGITKARLLRYRLDVGSLEVDSGGQAPARIRSPAQG